MNVALQCSRCGHPMHSSGLRGLCPQCLFACTTGRLATPPQESSAPDEESFVAGVAVGLDGRFVLLDKLGHGGMGEVWLANDQALSQEGEPHFVALKFLSKSIRHEPRALAALRAEVLRSQQLSHPNIVRISDLHTTREGMPFIKMEFVEGNSLTKWLEDQPQPVMPWKMVTQLTEQLASALLYAHETVGIVHRDIKPSNLLLADGPVVKLSDFGIARVAHDRSRPADDAAALGTIWYSSPQQIMGQPPTPADDVYALGATLYELLTGTPPFEAATTEELIEKIQNDVPEPIPQRLANLGRQNEVPSKLLLFVQSCLEKDPVYRPKTRELTRYLPLSGAGGMPPRPIVAKPIQWRDAPTPAKPRSLAWVWILVVALVAGAAWWQNWGDVRARGKDGAAWLVGLFAGGGCVNVTIQTANPSIAHRVVVLARNGNGITNELPTGRLELAVPKLKPGDYRLLVSEGPDGEGVTLEMAVAVEKHKTNHFAFQFPPPGSPQFGCVTVTIQTEDQTLPHRAVVLDRTGTGITNHLPAGRFRVEVPGLKPGSFLVLVSEGPVGSGTTLEEQVIVEANQTNHLTFPFGRPPSREGGSVIVSIKSDNARLPHHYRIFDAQRNTVADKVLPPGELEFETRELTAGSYRMQIAEGFEGRRWTLEEEWVVRPNQTNRLSFWFAKNEELTVDSEPPGALVQWPPGASLSSVASEARTPFTQRFHSGAIWFTARKPGHFELTTDYGFNPAVSRLLRLELTRSPHPLRGENWTNSLGMVFPWVAPLSNWVCATETRVSDFRRFTEAARYDATQGMFSLTATGFVSAGFSWSNPGFPQTDAHPVVGVSWEDANQFCVWLTRIERERGSLAANQSYRLPGTNEWFALAGGQRFPWGDDPKVLAGNYSGQEVLGPDWPPSWSVLSRHRDGYFRTAPVFDAGFRPSPLGLYHVGGNAAEWCQERVLCGGSWRNGEERDLNSLNTRRVELADPSQRHDGHGFRVLLCQDD